MVAEHKRKSWREMAGKVSCNTSMKEEWDIVRRIRGRPPAKINILEEEGIRYTTTPEICNKIANAFENITESTNYSPIFQNHKILQETEYMNLASNNCEVYYRDNSKLEMDTALQRAGNTTPGPDEITCEMLQQLTEEEATNLVKIFNKLPKDNSFPKQWRESIIIPIPKPDKSHSSPNNYRPISLTSTVCKTLERFLNARLYNYLRRRSDFAVIQPEGGGGE